MTIVPLRPNQDEKMAQAREEELRQVLRHLDEARNIVARMYLSASTPVVEKRLIGGEQGIMAMIDRARKGHGTLWATLRSGRE